MYSLVIVDDEIELREGLVNHFPWEKYGFKVRESFGSGQEALSWIKKNQADVILTDIRMPFMSGLDLIRRVKDLRGDSVLFCLLSAYKDFDYAQEGIHLGVRHYLIKPTDFNEIGDAFASIRKELDKREPQNLPYDGEYNLHIRKALSIMRGRPDTASLQNLADELGVNASYLSRLFKEETGRNFSFFLNEIRMAKAAELLTAHVSYKNWEIAEIVGYQDPQNFCRSFRRHFRMTPGAYRKEKLRQSSETE